MTTTKSKISTIVIAILTAISVFAVFTISTNTVEAKGAKFPKPGHLKIEKTEKTDKYFKYMGYWVGVGAPKNFKCDGYRYKWSMGATDLTKDLMTEKTYTKNHKAKVSNKNVGKKIKLSVRIRFKCTATHEVNGKTYKKGKIYLGPWATKEKKIKRGSK